MRSINPPTTLRSTNSMSGMTVAELMVAVGVGSLILLGMTVIFTTSSFNFAHIGNYINMDRSSRNALDRMTLNIRRAKSVISFDPARLVLKYDDAGTTNLTYRYDSSSRELTEEWTSGGNTTSKALLTGCDRLAFSMFNRDLIPTTDCSPRQGKLISVAWKCSGATILGQRLSTEDMQQAQILMRNQP